MLLPPQISKSGKCPVNMEPNVICDSDIDIDHCHHDGNCPGKEKCCRQGCFKVCQYPSTIIIAYNYGLSN